MNIRLRLELKDYRDWNIDYFYGSWRGKALVAVTVLLAIVTWYFASRMGVKSLAENPQILFVICLALLFLLLMPVSIFMQSQKAFRSDKFLQAEQEYGFGEAGFTVKSAHGSSDVPWNMVHKIRISRKFISIYISNIRAFVLPKRLMTAEEAAAIEALLKMKKPAA